MKNCPNCLSEVPDKAKVCGNCGHRFAIQTAVPPSQPAEPVVPEKEQTDFVSSETVDDLFSAFTWKLFLLWLGITLLGVVIGGLVPLYSVSFVWVPLAVALIQWLAFRRSLKFGFLWVILLPLAYFLQVFVGLFLRDVLEGVIFLSALGLVMALITMWGHPDLRNRWLEFLIVNLVGYPIVMIYTGVVSIFFFETFLGMTITSNTPIDMTRLFLHTGVLYGLYFFGRGEFQRRS